MRSKTIRPKLPLAKISTRIRVGQTEGPTWFNKDGERTEPHGGYSCESCEQSGRDTQPSFITGQDAAILGRRDCSKCNSPAVNKNALENVETGM